MANGAEAVSYETICEHGRVLPVRMILGGDYWKSARIWKVPTTAQAENFRSRRAYGKEYRRSWKSGEPLRILLAHDVDANTPVGERLLLIGRLEPVKVDVGLGYPGEVPDFVGRLCTQNEKSDGSAFECFTSREPGHRYGIWGEGVPFTAEDLWHHSPVHVPPDEAKTYAISAGAAQRMGYDLFVTEQPYILEHRTDRPLYQHLGACSPREALNIAENYLRFHDVFATYLDDTVQGNVNRGIFYGDLALAALPEAAKAAWCHLAWPQRVRSGPSARGAIDNRCRRGAERCESMASDPTLGRPTARTLGHSHLWVRNTGRAPGGSRIRRQHRVEAPLAWMTKALSRARSRSDRTCGHCGANQASDGSTSALSCSDSRSLSAEGSLFSCCFLSSASA